MTNDSRPGEWKVVSPLNDTAFSLAGVALPLVGVLPLTLIVIPLFFLASFLNGHVVAYSASSDGAEDAMVHHVTSYTAHNGT